MQNLIDELNCDHDLILKKMDELSGFLSEQDFAKTFPKLLEAVSFFEKFTFSEHHVREEKMLFKWMIEQNKNSDKELINKIIEDHKTLENLIAELRANIEASIQKKNSVSVSTIGSDLSFFISKYREHVERESSFIFAIASALVNAKNK